MDKKKSRRDEKGKGVAEEKKEKRAVKREVHFVVGEE